MGADKDWNLPVYCAFFLQGAGQLFPWNTFISAAGYFSKRFCTTHFKDDFENYFGVAFNVANVALLYISVRYLAHRSLEKRVVRPLVANGIVFGLTTLLVLVDLDADAMFGLTMLLVILSGMTVAVLQGGMFGLSGQLPPAYTQAMMAGQGMGGLIVSLSSLLTIAADSSNSCDDDDDAASDDDGCDDFETDWSSFTYFAIATLVITSCIVSYFWLVNHPFVKQRREQAAASQPLLEDGDSDAGPSGARVHSINPEDESAGEMTSAEIFAKIRMHAINVFLTFFITLSVFPSVTAKIVSVDECPKESNMWYNDLFVPWSFVMFNLWDYVGRSSAGFQTLQNLCTDSVYTTLTYARFVFIPLFLFSNVADSNLPVWFKSDVTANLFMLAFAISNGFLGSVAMMRGPGCLENTADQRAAGTMMVFCLTIGLAAGSFVSFAWEALLTGDEPF